MDKYEERVLSRIALVGGIFARNQGKPLSDIIIEIAEQGVKWEAEAYESAYRQLSELRGWKTPTIESHIKGHLQSLGLVPENAPGNDPGIQ